MNGSSARLRSELNEKLKRGHGVKPKSKPSVKPRNRHAVRLSKQPDRKRLGASSHK